MSLSKTTIASLSLLALASLSGCYDPQLGDNPYLCSTDESVTECPQDYICMGGICVLEEPPTKGDAGADSGNSMLPDPTNCPDKNIEPNETKDKAIPVGFGRNIDLAIC